MYKLLVIDDEVGPRESIRMLLKDDYEIFLADHVDEGLRLLQEHKPEAVIMDIRMPGKNGIEGLSELRDIDPHVSVIMLTGFGALETAQEAMRLGANDYLKKPFDMNELREAVLKYAQRTKLERRKVNALDELYHLNAHLHEQVMFKEQLATVGEASAEFAHDLRNPLSIVIGYCQLLAEELHGVGGRKGRDYGETLEYLQAIEANVKRCAELAERWQKMGGPDAARYEPVALDELLDELIKSIEPLTMIGPERVKYDLSLEPVRVKADRAQLLRALHNVITNALHALPSAGGQLSIRCAAEDEQAIIAIGDNGSGIPKEILARVFEKHFTTKPPSKGTGLGLTITRKIAQEHGGDVSIDSEPGMGTTVTIRLPLLRDA